MARDAVPVTLSASRCRDDERLLYDLCRVFSEHEDDDFL